MTLTVVCVSNCSVYPVKVQLGLLGKVIPKWYAVGGTEVDSDNNTLTVLTSTGPLVASDCVVLSWCTINGPPSTCN